MNKLGSYITKLMTTVLDSEQEEFVRELALSELTRLNVDVNDFIRKHTIDDFDKAKETEKKLLQEDKKNVKNK
jgi:ribosomal protein S17E